MSKERPDWMPKLPVVIAEIPDWLYEETIAADKRASEESRSKRRSGRRVVRVGEGGRNDELYRRLSAAFPKIGLDFDEMLNEADRINANFDPPLDAAELRKTTGSMFSRAIDENWRYNEQPAHEARGGEYVISHDNVDGVTTEARLVELNAECFVAEEGNKAYVYTTKREPARDASGRPLIPAGISRLSPRDFCSLHDKIRVRFDMRGNDKPTMNGLGSVWMRWHHRSTFQGVVFDPTREPGITPDLDSSHFNRWIGFDMPTPEKPRPCPLILSHIENVLADGDEEKLEYILGWLALVVQRPADRAETALVFRGGEGTGKGTIGNLMLSLLAPYGTAVHSGRHLTGSFNPHLRDCLLLFADEAFFAGDKQHVSTLKALITEERIVFESKFVDAEQGINRLSVIMASNEAWVVPAGPTARRFAVFDVSESRRGDVQYFEALHRELDNGGREGFLYFLHEYDLGHYNPRIVPSTLGLVEQKILTLSPFHRWISELAETESLIYSDSQHGKPKALEYRHTSAELRRSYQQFCRENRLHPDSAAPVLFTKALRELGGRTCSYVNGEHVRGFELCPRGEKPAIALRLAVERRLDAAGLLDTVADLPDSEGP